MRSTVILAATLAVFTSSVAQADIQTKGPEVWPGKHEVDVHLGYQNGFFSTYNVNSNGAAVFAPGPASGLRIAGDYGYRLADYGVYSIWLNVGASLVFPFSFATSFTGAFAGYSNNGLELAVFAGLKLKWRTPIPLVPYAKFNIEGAGLFNRYCGDDGFGVLAHVAGGAKYFLTPAIGVGVELGFTGGPGVYQGTTFGACNGYYYSPQKVHVEFYGALDASVGAELNF